MRGSAVVAKEHWGPSRFALRISPRGSNAAKTAQVRILAAQPELKIAGIAPHRTVTAEIGKTPERPMTAIPCDHGDVGDSRPE
jgi:hypothetical protein